VANGQRAGKVAEPLLEVEDLNVFYGAVQVLFGVDLHVSVGETLALLGTNGAGKSTALKAISGLIPVSTGRVVFDGIDITNRSTEERVSAGIVQVRGGTGVFPSLSIQENLRLGGFTIMKDRKRLASRIEAALDLFPELSTRLNQRVGTMSGGEQQMVALAKAMLLEPRLLVIDELTLGLAPIITERLLQVVDELKRSGLTMLIVEQSLNVALNFADRAVFMERGEVRFSGDPVELAQNGDLVRAVFLGQAVTS
jgi:ABC-type branched-subunit amino acid transport system ATPase component